MLLTPLNRDSNGDGAVVSTLSKKTTKEAQVNNENVSIGLLYSSMRSYYWPQESACFQEYHDALKVQRDGDLIGAKALYMHLLQSSFLTGEV